LNREALNGGNGSDEEKETEKKDEPLKFPIPAIEKKIFEQVVKWMVEQDGKLEILITDPITEEVFLLPYKIPSETNMHF
jgi:hypothetical protein